MNFKRIATLALGSAAALALVATPSFAAVSVTDGAGFVGKGDVQLSFGWNNKQLQTNAGGVTFTHATQEKFDITCEWDTVTGGKNSKTIEHAVTVHRTANVSANIAYDARTRNQINGFHLNGFQGEPVETGGPVPAVGDSCPMAHETAVVTDVTSDGPTGGLFVNHGGTAVALPNTPIS